MTCVDCGVTSNVRDDRCGDCRSDRAWARYYTDRELAGLMRALVREHEHTPASSDAGLAAWLRAREIVRGEEARCADR